MLVAILFSLIPIFVLLINTSTSESAKLEAPTGQDPVQVLTNELQVLVKQGRYDDAFSKVE